MDASPVPDRAAPVPPAGSWRLRFLRGPLRGRTLALKPGANLLGSSGDCDVMLPGGDVLPQHLVFAVGELVVSVQKVGAATAELNGEPIVQPRRSVVAGDVITVGQIEFQLDRVYAAQPADEGMFAGADTPHAPAAEATEAAAAPRALPLRRVGAGLVGVSLVGIVALAAWGGTGGRGSANAVNLGAVEQALAGYPEVETVAAPGGGVTVRGYVESRARRQALQKSLERFGPLVGSSVISAEEMVEQARRFVSDPGVTVAYAGQGRLVVSGTVENEAVRQQIRRLTEDLHPMVLVSDKVTYRPNEVKPDDGAASRAQWDAWQNVLPSRMVGITEDSNGLRHIQLANGSRYYEGSLLRSGAQLERIDADRLVISGGTPPKERR